MTVALGETLLASRPMIGLSHRPATSDPAHARRPRGGETRRTRWAWRALVTVAVLVPALGSPQPAQARRPSRSTLQLAALQVGSLSGVQRSALSSWSQEVRLRTSVRIAQEAAVVSAKSSKVLRYPMLLLAGDRGLGKVSAAEVTRLREHLTTGGLLLIDDTGRSGTSPAFDTDVRALVRRLMGRALVRVPRGDVVYRTFYRLDRPVGRRATVDHLEGVRVGKRWAVLYHRNDLHGAFLRAATGGPALPALPGGERQREMAWRLGVNLVVYALCLDYKDDHTHVGHLLRRRRGR